MYLKRTSKLLDLTVSRTATDVHLRDVTCPICRGILIEPVSLPCQHNLCLRCMQATFEHNSLTCPLCRSRVSSWVRLATKSDNLVNNKLWELIKSKFPKEVENKHNGEEGDLGLDADYAVNRILSAPGEIHKEYKAQLQMAEEEMRRQRQAEQIASEALIQKIKAEEKHFLAQLAQDQFLAKTLAKQQQKEAAQKETTKCYNECMSVPSYSFNDSKFNYTTAHVNNIEMPCIETVQLEGRHVGLPESVRDSSKTRQINMPLLSKMEMYSNVYGSKEASVSDMHKNPIYCCQKQISVYNAVAKKRQTISKFTQPCTSNYSMEPGCSSSSKAYATETKEELRVPSDVVNNKKKSLGIEVCMTLADDDERIGSAESSGSHDSINQEIHHHFKPIKTVPRTKFLISSDGKQIDPKLIRVIPILKKVSNVVPKPPSLIHVKRIGCSWSAFRGKIRQDAQEKHITHNQKDTETNIDQEPSTSFIQSQAVSNKSTMKSQTNDTFRRLVRRLNFILEPSFDSNKNYTKNANKVINGTKINKKLNDELDVKKSRKSWRTTVQNGMIAKSKRYRNLRSRKETKLTVNVTNEKKDDPTSSNLSFSKSSPQIDEQDDDDVPVENIAERIKKRKENAEKKTLEPEMESKKGRTTTKRKALPERIMEIPVADQATLSISKENVEINDNFTRKTKRQRKCTKFQNNTKDLEKNDDAISGLRKSTRNLTRISSMRSESDTARNKNNSKFNYDSSSESYDETDECVPEDEHAAGKLLSDEEVIKEQERIERLLLQEREDFELARRLQAQYDEMERISRRTRRSRQIIESERGVNVNLREINAAKIVRRTNGVRKTAKRKSVVTRVMNSVTKGKRGRPKRIKITVDAREDETRTR